MMNISEQLSREQFQEMLIRIYQKGEESENIRTIDFINEIKQQLLAVMSGVK